MIETKINLPDQFIFSLKLPVRIYDVNYGNHLGHDSLVSLLHEARMVFLKEHHFSEANKEFGLIMASLHVLYKSQAFYGDELTISIGVSEVTRTSFYLIYVVQKIEIEVARAYTKMVCFDYEKQRIKKIPDGFLKILI